MMLGRLRSYAMAWTVAAVSLTNFSSSALAGVSFQNPTGGWRYSYGGTFNAGVGSLPPGYGQSNRTQALDGTWRHDQSDKWDGTGIGDTQNPGQSTQKSPGGISAITEGGDSFIRLQDAGNPESWGFVQANPQPPNSNRRMYFGHQLDNDGGLPSGPLGQDGQRVLELGITLSFRARIPNPETNTLDPIYPDASDTTPGLSGITPWGTVGGGGYPIHDSGRGMFNVVQNDPANFNSDGGIAFSLMTSKDRDVYGPASPVLGGAGTGGLLMNNLNGNVPSAAVDTASGGTLNLFPLTDAQLYDWNEFWITISADTAAFGGNGTGTNLVTVYHNGSTTPTTFHVTSSSDNTMEYVNNAWIAMGLSSTLLYGSVDVDFFNYSLGILTPVAVPPSLPGDVNHDGIVNGQDIAVVASHWLFTGDPVDGDANDDGIVNGQDIAVIASHWLQTSGPGSGEGASVPEPTSMLLAVMALATGACVARVRKCPLA